VEALGAVQAQDPVASLWAVGIRTRAATEASVERAIANREIVRTWPMRGTLHLVAAEDVRWMLELLTPRVIAASAGRQRQLELDATVFARCRKVISAAFRDGGLRTREALHERLEEAGIDTGKQRGYHILWRLSQEGMLCCGPRVGRQQSFALLDDWVPKAAELDREAALVELAHRYFSGHGPATVRDLANWAGLKLSDTRVGVAGAAHRLESEWRDGVEFWFDPGVVLTPRTGSESSTDSGSDSGTDSDVHLLPAFDEFILGYKDRSAVLDPAHAPLVVPGGNGVFQPIVVMAGRVIGTWKRAVRKDRVLVDVRPFARLGRGIRPSMQSAVERYGRFLGMPAEVRADDHA